MTARISIITLCCVAWLASCSGGSTNPAAAGSGTVGAESVSAANPYGVPFPPTPDPDPFYAKPDPMPDVPPGTILKTRPVVFKPALGIALSQGESFQAWQLQYMTRDVNDKPLPAVATVVKPPADLVPLSALDSVIPASMLTTLTATLPLPTQAPKLMAYQLAYDSLGNACSPSHSLTGDTANSDNQEETLVYLAGLAAYGWTMVFPDYEGPYNAYGAGKLAGQATLDAIRAALHFEPLGLAHDTPVGMWGYSGGALATSWAATLQPAYAPELNIVGAASGGTPADVFNVVDSTQNGPFFNLIFSAVVGANRAYPEILPMSLLTAKGRKTIESEVDSCTAGGPLFGLSAPANFSDYTNIPNPFDTPGAKAVHELVTLPQKDQSPTTDMYVYHQYLDEIIPIAGTTKMVDAWCKAGTAVAYEQDLTGDHVAGTATGTPAAFLYLVGRFHGEHLVPPTAQTCNY